MVSDRGTREDTGNGGGVLILVLMEYGLWRNNDVDDFKVTLVLILVLMEYGLWLKEFLGDKRRANVLILVLMEYGLWLGIRGRWSLTPSS